LNAGVSKATEPGRHALTAKVAKNRQLFNAQITAIVLFYTHFKNLAGETWHPGMSKVFHCAFTKKASFVCVMKHLNAK